MTNFLKTTACALLLFIGASAYGQTSQEKALELGHKAILLMDNGQIEESVKLLQEAQQLDPDNIAYPYEIAYASYLQHDYKEAVKRLSKLENNKDASDRVFQLLGNCYGIMGKPDRAIDAYEKGLKKYPNTGFLYLELGIIYMNSNNFEKAISNFEQGIYVDPKFPSNYYWAAKLYGKTTEEMWSVLYGEIFMNLERNSQRTAEISKLLYDTYKRRIAFTSDTSISVNFSKHSVVDGTKLPYAMVYEPILLMSIVNEREIDINSLDRIRRNFVINYYEKEFNKNYPNALIEYQKEILDAGHLEAYNHWILMKGDESNFEEWVARNKGKWNSFVTWFTSNKLQIDSNNRFYSGQYQ
jgi:Putative Zn-dependent protease, contains TPR repeats